MSKKLKKLIEIGCFPLFVRCFPLGCLICLFLSSCNLNENKRNKTSGPLHLEIPKNWKVTSTYKMHIPANKALNIGPAFLLFSDLEDTVNRSAFSKYGSAWAQLDSSTGKQFKGFSVCELSADHLNYSISFNDTAEHNENGEFIVGHDTVALFPNGADTILASPRGRYLALLVAQPEVADRIDIIDVSELLRTGHYKTVKSINPYPGDISGLVKWIGDSNLVVESNISLIGLNTKNQLDDADELNSSDSVKLYNYNISTNLFSSYTKK